MNQVPFTVIQTGKTDLKLDSLHLLTLITKLQSRLAFCIQCSAFCKIPLSFGHPSAEYMLVVYHLTWRPTNGSTCRPTLDHMSDTQSIRQVSSVSRILVDCQWHNNQMLYNVICVNQKWHVKTNCSSQKLVTKPTTQEAWRTLPVYTSVTPCLTHDSRSRKGTVFVPKHGKKTCKGTD